MLCLSGAFTIFGRSKFYILNFFTKIKTLKIVLTARCWFDFNINEIQLSNFHISTNCFYNSVLPTYFCTSFHKYSVCL